MCDNGAVDTKEVMSGQQPSYFMNAGHTFSMGRSNQSTLGGGAGRGGGGGRRGGGRPDNPGVGNVDIVINIRLLMNTARGKLQKRGAYGAYVGTCSYDTVVVTTAETERHVHTPPEIDFDPVFRTHRIGKSICSGSLRLQYEKHLGW